MLDFAAPYLIRLSSASVLIASMLVTPMIILGIRCSSTGGATPLCHQCSLLLTGTLLPGYPLMPSGQT